MDRRTIVGTLTVALALLLAPTTAPPALAAGEAGAKQVVYTTADKHIHELSVTVGGSWQHADLTQLTGAPIVYVGLSAYAWEAGGSKQVLYKTADNHIHELYANVGGSWQHADLTQLTSAPLPAGNADLIGYAWEPNLLRNSGFELDANSDTQPDQWTSDSHFTRSNTTKHSGSFAGRHFATDDSSYTTSSQTINNLRPGEAYNVAGWVKIPPTSDSFSFEIRVLWFWGNFPMATDAIHTYLDDTGGAWQLVSANKIAPAGTTSAQLQMVVSNLNATIYVDDFVFGP
jgi:hypothetical protein